MPKNAKPGFTYIFSQALNQEIALQDSSGKVFCEDGTIYSMDEVKILNEKFGEIPIQVHLLKKKFGGTILDDTRRNENK